MKFQSVVLLVLLFGASGFAEPWAYVVNGQQQFGVVNLSTGAFQQIGPTTPEGQANLVWGPSGELYSLTYSGNLETIDPRTGETTVVGATGLGYNAFDLAGVRGKLYATDFNNNLYRVDWNTGLATLIGATGMPPDPSIPFTVNADGTWNLCDESFYGANGKIYATFDSFTIDPTTLAITSVVSADLYEIDPETGNARLVAPTSMNLGASLDERGRFYAFHIAVYGFGPFGPEATSQLVTLDRKNGLTKFITNIDAAAGMIFGAAPVREQETK